MKRVLAFSLLLLLFACEYNNIEAPAALPVRAIHISEASGKQIAIQTFTYDSKGRIINDNLSADPTVAYSEENIYEYDFEGNLVKQTTNYSIGNDAISVHIREKTWLNGKLTYEKEYDLREGEEYNTLGKRYFYNFGVLDSAWQIGYENVTGRVPDQYTLVYERLNAGRLLKENRKNNEVAITWTVYDDKNNLSSRCEELNGEPNFCEVVNVYDDNGRTTKVSRTYGSLEYVLEELSYNGDRLIQKRKIDYPFYGDVNQPVATIIKYEYQ